MRPTLLMLSAALLAVAGFVSNGCESAPDCSVCLGGTVGATCGWCAVNTTTATSTGPQCVDLHSTFDCNIQFQTDKCVQGWKCAHNHTNNQSQCVPSQGGIADKQKCEQSCAHPPPHPTPPSPPKPKHAFHCNMNNMTCTPAPFGDPTMQDCQQHCKQAYTCDQAAKKCSMAAPNATGHKYYDQSECAQHCPFKPMPVPWEMRGIWRGLAIHNSYHTGEWLADITNSSVTIWYPDAASKAYKLYMKGAASAVGIAGKYLINVDSTAGKLKNAKIAMLAGDYSMNPEVKGFLQLAVDENHLTQEVTSFDSGMTQATVLSFETCPEGGAPPPPPGPPPPPPPCKAKLDMVVILDGSASIAPTDWQHALSFTNQLVNGFHLAPDQVEIGIVQFSESADTVIGLSSDASAVHSAISNLQQMRLNTNTYAGFSQAKSIIDSQGRAGTAGKLVLIVTDGMQNEGAPAKQVADKLKAEGVQVFGIGVGSQVSPTEIQSWCSTPLSTHYFSVTAFSALKTVINKILQSSCPPPALAAGLKEYKHMMEAMAANASKNCKFHLPPNLPTTTTGELRYEEIEDAAPSFLTQMVEVDAVAAPAPPAADKCNAFSTCKTCIAAHTQGETCGWCTGDITYAGASTPSQYKCAGAHGTATSKFTCSGHFQTSTCTIPGGCGLEGIYRGLRIDNEYDFGEWQLHLTSYNTSEQVTIKSLDISGKVVSTTEGKLQCAADCKTGNSQQGVNFTLTTTKGSILHGICGWTEQVQAETHGLMWAISDPGVATPPKTFDGAMLNTSKAEVFTYYKCGDYQKACTFTAV